MIPTTVAVIGGDVGATRRAPRMLIAETYVMGLAAAYAVVGALAGIASARTLG